MTHAPSDYIHIVVEYAQLSAEERESRKREFVLSVAKALKAKGATSDTVGFIAEAQLLRTADVAEAAGVSEADALAAVKIADLLTE